MEKYLFFVHLCYNYYVCPIQIRRSTIYEKVFLLSILSLLLAVSVSAASASSDQKTDPLFENALGGKTEDCVH